MQTHPISPHKDSAFLPAHECGGILARFGEQFVHAPIQISYWRRGFLRQPLIFNIEG